MEIFIKHFSELTALELYDILELRSRVFVVEQNCVYQDLDGIDKDAYHVWARDGRGVVACLRVYDKNGVHIGRVVTAYRREGLGSLVMERGIAVAEEKYAAKKILISAQQYARPFYERFGFKNHSAPYLEDGIPHIAMIRSSSN